MDYILSILSVTKEIDDDSGKFSNLIICNDLLKINSIPLEKIKEIIYLGKSGKKQEFITAEIINLVFNSLDDNNNDITPIISFISFITRNLRLIPLESDVRLILYKNIFSQSSFILMNSIIEKIFTIEFQQNKEIFFMLMKNPEESLQSIRLKTINDNIKDIGSNIAELCCNIIQKIFSKLEFNELSPYFKYAIESFVQEDLLLQQLFILQQITSIAFLKEFINQFWKKYFSLSSSMIKEINDIMKINNDNPFIQSIRSYFALELNSFDYIKQHEIIKEEFTWLDDCKDKKITYLSKLLKPIKRINFEEPISEEKRLIILALLDPSKSLYNSSNSIDLPEVISLFETILCFIKELSIKHNNILILDLIDQWLKLMRYDITYADILKEFSLKHIISFYELIEEQVANSIIDKIDEKFKTPLTQQMKDSIKNIIDYDDSENQNQQRIPAKAFAFALKRFIYRFLLVDFNIENLNLNTYFLDFTLNLWSDVNEESVEKLFPTCLLVSHAYNSYNFIVEEIEKTMNERQNSRRGKYKKHKKYTS
ncbi:unnamed protein product [Rhizophagus irregularis]|uniref:Uncharacterized protein n=1 Tax=Rhizophagus irregularis TaxID=588596 RepID=A0A916EI42_9GLOM|nr:unnamed protein product [Rhizophagus irregularis]